MFKYPDITQKLTTLVWLHHRGVLERSEPVPFRLTRNLQTFFTPFGVEGVFITAMAVAAQVGLHLLCSLLPTASSPAVGLCLMPWSVKKRMSCCLGECSACDLGQCSVLIKLSAEHSSSCNSEV